jgi:hypothetical protein
MCGARSVVLIRTLVSDSDDEPLVASLYALFVRDCSPKRTCPVTLAGYCWVMRGEWSLKRVSDVDLLRRLADLVGRSRCLDADVVAHIAEVDERRLYAREAMPSMFVYCVETLRLGENEAYLRIAAGRASREYPVLLEMLRDGRLHLTAVARLASHLTPENHRTVLERATNRSKREIGELIAELAPRPNVAATIRKLPARSGARQAGEPGTPELRSATESQPGLVPELVPERVESGALKSSRERLRSDEDGALPEAAPAGGARVRGDAAVDR